MNAFVFGLLSHSIIIYPLLQLMFLFLGTENKQMERKLILENFRKTTVETTFSFAPYSLSPRSGSDHLNYYKFVVSSAS
jgi:hypothetical protein